MDELLFPEWSRYILIARPRSQSDPSLAGSRNTEEFFFAPSVVRARDIINVGVHNWTDFCREKLHPAGMHHDRIQKITTEMCDLLNEQTEWLKSSTGRLTAQSGEAVEEYVHRNDRLRQLGAELSDLD